MSANRPRRTTTAPIFDPKALFTAISKGDVNKVNAIIAEYNARNPGSQDIFKVVNKKGQPPLIYAIQQNKPDIVEALVQAGADVNEVVWNDWAPLALAAITDDGSILHILINNGANINYANEKGNTALTAAIANDNVVAVEILLQNGATIGNALYTAALHDSRFVIPTLIAAGANIDAQNHFGQTPLFVAAKYKRPEIVEELLKAKANPNILNHEGESAIFKAADNGYTSIVRMLLQSPHLDGSVVLLGDEFPIAYIEDAQMRNKTILDMAKLGKFTLEINAMIKDTLAPPNPNNLPSRTIPRLMPNSANNTQMVPAYNIITGENIKNGNILTNFRGKAPNANEHSSFESERGRYYTFGTARKLTLNPFTREPITNKTHYVARFPPENGTAEGGRRRRKTRATRRNRRRRHTRKAH